MDSANKDWPKRPFLDFTQQQDESIIIKVGTEPNYAEFKISRLHLDYYSPYFRVCLASNMKEGLSGVVELHEVKPEIFRHIIQYMNVQTILISGPQNYSNLQAVAKIALQEIPGFDTILDMPEWGGTTSTGTYSNESLDLGTLARIWFLAHYFMIPHVQNMAINFMYRRLLLRGTPDCHFGELVDAMGVALGIDGTTVAEANEVQKFFENYLASCSSFDKWTPEQRAMIPRKIMDGAMVSLREHGRAQVTRGPIFDYTPVNRMKCVGSFFVVDRIDGGQADSGLETSFYHFQDNELP